MSDMAIRDAVRRFTVDEYHRLADTGIVDADERLELLDGQLVLMTPIGKPHWVIHGELVHYLLDRFPGRAVIGQGSFPLGDRNEPQPDIAVLAHPGPFYLDHPVPPADLLALIELADSSLSKDLGMKARLYARFAIPDYVVVDVDSSVVIHHSRPQDERFTRIERYVAGHVFRFTAMPEIELSAGAFLARTGAGA